MMIHSLLTGIATTTKLGISWKSIKHGAQQGGGLISEDPDSGVSVDSSILCFDLYDIVTVSPLIL